MSVQKRLLLILGRILTTFKFYFHFFAQNGIRRIFFRQIESSASFFQLFGQFLLSVVHLCGGKKSAEEIERPEAESFNIRRCCSEKNTECLSFIHVLSPNMPRCFSGAALVISCRCQTSNIQATLLSKFDFKNLSLPKFKVFFRIGLCAFQFC